MKAKICSLIDSKFYLKKFKYVEVNQSKDVAGTSFKIVNTQILDGVSSGMDWFVYYRK
jgi:hypothetical protein